MQKKHYKNIGETLYTEVLPNGLTINIVPKPDYTKTYAMFATNYGGADRRFKLGGQWIDTPAGVAHFLEHKMFDLPGGENALNILSSRGASPNAFTSSGMTAYYFDCTDSFDENLRTLLHFVSTPYFTAESVQKEQGIIGQEIRMIEDNPGFAVYNRLMRCLYASNPVRDSVAGTVDSIAEITDQTLYHCHNVFYNPSNMTLAVVGNADPEAVIAAAMELLPADGGEIPKRDYGSKESELPVESLTETEMEVSAPQFLFGAKVTPEETGLPRLRQMLVGDVALSLVFGHSSPLYTKLYESGLLTGSFDYEADYCAGTASILVSGESRDVSAVSAALNEEIQNIISGGLDEKRFENTKKALFGLELRALGSFSSLAQSLVSGSFAGFCPLDAFDALSSISIQEVRDYIARYLSSEKIALSIINPQQR